MSTDVKLVDPVCRLAFTTHIEVGPLQVIGDMEGLPTRAELTAGL